MGLDAGTCRSYGVVAVRIKSDVASWPQGRTQEKWCVRPGLYSGMILLYATEDGAPLALIQDGYLQHLRVGAAAGIGAELLEVLRGTPVPGMEWKAGGIAAYVSGQPDERTRIPAGSARETGTYPSMLDVRRGRAAGRTTRDQVTLFVTTGTQGLQFAAVAGRTLQAARKSSVGTIPTEWFLQDIRD